MRTIYWIVGMALLVMVASCTKDDFHKTGVSNGRFDGSMLEYMKAHHYDWDSTVLMVEQAGLESLFDGDEPITFFGPTNLSILRYMLRNNIERVKDMTPEFCRETLLRHVMKGKMKRTEFPYGTASSEAGEVVGKDGGFYTMMGGNRIWAYTRKGEYNGVKEAGALLLHISSIDKNKKIDIASGDIEPDNGMVHSLSYVFTLGEM